MPGKKDLLPMEAKGRANPSLVGAMQRGQGAPESHQGLLGLVIAWMGNIPLEQGDLDGSPPRRE